MIKTETTKNLKTTYEHGYCDAHHPVLAAIDLGTNSCRLLIASVNIASLKKTFFRTRPNPQGWKIIDSYAKIVRLGERLLQDDMLASDAIDRAIEALRICKRKIDSHRVLKLRAVATEACRRAKNSHVLVDRAMSELNLKIDIVSAEEEALLALTGCAGILTPKVPYGTVFDIGGGSTEVIFVKINEEGRQKPGYPVVFEVIDSISVPYGVVTMSELYAQFASSPEIHKNIRDMVKVEIDKFIEKNNISPLIEEKKLQMVGSSGTVTTIAAIKMGLQRYERKKIDGMSMDLQDINDICDSLIKNPDETHINHPCISEGRADLVIVGSAILQGICDALPTESLRVADRGVREGILSELLLGVTR